MSWIPSYKKPSGGSYTPPTWSDGTDEEIVEALEKHYAGEIDLTEYWSVGDERVISLSAMSATYVSETHTAQDVTFVLSHIGGKTLSDGTTECVFQVDQKNCLSEPGIFDSSGYSWYSNAYTQAARRKWCNEIYYASLPATLKPIFKLYANITGSGTGSNTATSMDYFALRAEKEVTGWNSYANSTAESSLTQIDWYKTSSNRIKNMGDNGYANSWWLRSSCKGTTSYTCNINTSGNGARTTYYYDLGIAPFGVI